MIAVAVPIGIGAGLFIDEHLNCGWGDIQPISRVLAGQLALAREILIGCAHSTIEGSCASHRSVLCTTPAIILKSPSFSPIWR
jgi:hypothetical protein